MCWSKLDFYSVKENGNIFAFILQESPKPHPPHGYYIHGDVGELKFFFFFAVAANWLVILNMHILSLEALDWTVGEAN